MCTGLERSRVVLVFIPAFYHSLTGMCITKCMPSPFSSPSHECTASPFFSPSHEQQATLFLSFLAFYHISHVTYPISHINHMAIPFSFSSSPPQALLPTILSPSASPLFVELYLYLSLRYHVFAHDTPFEFLFVFSARPKKELLFWILSMTLKWKWVLDLESDV